uniref:O-acyltransferase like n=1 Tax=Oryzias latipes TaxID=8090 RepID=A0A3P9J8A9_ORYLA
MAPGWVVVLLLVRSAVTQEEAFVLSKRCMKDTGTFLWEIQQDKPKEYAVRMYDAFGKMGSNVEAGNVNQPGAPQQCRSAVGPTFSGKYCQVFLRQGAVQYFVGICVPDSCGEEDVKTLVMQSKLQIHEKSMVPPLSPILNNQSTQEMIMTHCSSDRNAPDASDVTYSTPSILCFPQSCVYGCLQAFSLQTTSQSIFNSSSSSTHGGYSSLNGIRVLSLLWIICGHSAQFPVINNLGMPLHVFTMCLTISLISLVPWGPYWFPFIDTMMDFHDICIPWTWYLSLDFQCYTTTPLLVFFYRLYVLCKYIKSFPSHLFFSNKRVFAIVAGSLLLLTTMANSTIVIWTSENYVLDYYVKPYTRYGPFLIGIMTGIHLRTKKKLLLRQKAALGWFCCLSVMALLVGLAYILRETPAYPSLPHALYQALHRPLWALSVSWIILACEEGYGGFITNLLSLKFWVPLSNISFACYLVHPIFIILYSGLQETPIHYTDMNFMYLFFGHLVLTLPLSYVLSLLVEKPYLLLKGGNL